MPDAPTAYEPPQVEFTGPDPIELVVELRKLAESLAALPDAARPTMCALIEVLVQPPLRIVRKPDA